MALSASSLRSRLLSATSARVTSPRLASRFAALAFLASRPLHEAVVDAYMVMYMTRANSTQAVGWALVLSVGAEESLAAGWVGRAFEQIKAQESMRHSAGGRFWQETRQPDGVTTCMGLLLVVVLVLGFAHV